MCHRYLRSQKRQLRAVERGAEHGTEVCGEVCGGDGGNQGGYVGEGGREEGDGSIVEVVARSDGLDEGEWGVACADYGNGRGFEGVGSGYC